MDISGYWNKVLEQNEDGMREYFHKNAVIKLHNTNEKFTVEEFIEINCDYPGKWKGEIERIERIKISKTQEIEEELIITAVNVLSRDDVLSFHAVSFIKVKNDKIIEIDEYWGDDGEIPEWRKKKKIGTRIK